MRPCQALLFTVAVLTALLLLDVDRVYSGAWQRGTAMTSLVPAAPTLDIALVAEDVACTLGGSFAEVEASYVLQNTSQQPQRLRAGLWRYGSDYLNGVSVRVSKLLFRDRSPMARGLGTAAADPLAEVASLFKKHGIRLSSNAALAAVEAGRLWRLGDGEARYTLEKGHGELYVYGAEREAAVEMVEFENQDAFTGPDYLFSLDFVPSGRLRVEVRCHARLSFNKDGATWLFYAGQHGRAWAGESERATVRFFSPVEHNRRFLEASPAGFTETDGVVLWDDVSLIRRERLFARYLPNR